MGLTVPVHSSVLNLSPCSAYKGLYDEAELAEGRDKPTAAKIPQLFGAIETASHQFLVSPHVKYLFKTSVLHHLCSLSAAVTGSAVQIIGIILGQ